jgi:hypothetical protein
VAQTQEPSQSKLSPDLPRKVKDPTKIDRSKRLRITIDPEVLKEYKGRYPSGIRDQAVAINRYKKEDAKEKVVLKRIEDNKVIETKKIDAFFAEFLKNGGNATDAAMKVFNVSSRANAASIGSVYLKKCRALGRVVEEDMGITYKYLMQIAKKNVETSKMTDWWDRLMELGDYGNFRTVKGIQAPNTTNINIMQSEKELFKKYTREVPEEDVSEEEPIE